MNELPDDLERALRELDERAGRRAARVSPERVAARVVARLRAEPAGDARGVVRPWSARRRWVGLAAAALLVVTAGGVVLSQVQRRAAEAVPVPVVARALDSLDLSGLERVLRVTGEVRPQGVEPVSVSSSDSFDDLSEAQLRAVLQAVQQSEGGTL